MRAMLLLKDIADMILESNGDDCMLVFEDKDGEQQTQTYEVDWADWPEDTIVVRLL